MIKKKLKLKIGEYEKYFAWYTSLAEDKDGVIQLDVEPASMDTFIYNVADSTFTMFVYADGTNYLKCKIKDIDKDQNIIYID